MTPSTSCNNFSNLPPREAYYALWTHYEYQFNQLIDDVEWQKIPGYENYEINSLSVVRHNKSNGGKRKILVQTLRNNKYFYVTLTNENGRRVGFPVDKLMIMTFFEIQKDKIRYVIHFDKIKHNNQLKNLNYIVW